jgi:hypothetical protein
MRAAPSGNRRQVDGAGEPEANAAWACGSARHSRIQARRGAGRRGARTGASVRLGMGVAGRRANVREQAARDWSRRELARSE